MGLVLVIQPFQSGPSACRTGCTPHGAAELGSAKVWGGTVVPEGGNRVCLEFRVTTGHRTYLVRVLGFRDV